MDDEGLLPIERVLRRRLDALGPDGRAELLRALELKGEERAAVIGTCMATRGSRTSQSSWWTWRGIWLPE
jgi:hypothetical protein